MTTTVAVTRFWLDWISVDVPRVVRQWTITRGSYVAVIDECPCGLRGLLSRGQYRLRRTGKRSNCLCRNEACRNSPERKGVCHGWHQARIDAMVAELDRPKARKTGQVGIPVSSLRPYAYVGRNGYRWSDIYASR